MKEKITVKTYHANATVFGEEKSIEIGYDAGTLACYGDKDCYDNEKEAIEDYENDLRQQLTEAFPNADADNIDDVVLSIMIYAQCSIGSFWN